ncbi:MAG: hypothetical protein K8R69_00900 [Deltaproteobacteria bacterium]|nr:hypothetical protein [Deltaproteobacteria bacterium]
MKNSKQKHMGGFDYYRTREQIVEYMKTPAKEKLLWLEEMRELNNLVAKHNPRIAKIQEKFRKGEN